MALLVFIGKRYSGKTMSANIILETCRELGVPVKKYSFANPLRRMYSEAKLIPIELLTNKDTKELYRYDMMEFAQELKNKDPDIFIKSTVKYVKTVENCVIDDCRRLEELGAMQKLGGVPFKIFSSNKSRGERGWTFNSDVDNDPTETELPDLSASIYRDLGGGEIINNTTPEDLKKRLLPIITKHFLKL